MELQEPKVVKAIIPSTCPHCAKQIFLSFQTMVPSIISITTDQDIKAAKEDALKRLDSIVFKNEENKQQIITWLKAEETLLEQNDVEPILKELLKENV
ncbi:MAG: hypothetical protein WCX73_05245 [Candidatus Pacearchaeota archaeon]|jgi:hypothetical protein